MSILAGPFLGELGWELMQWIPVFRNIKEQCPEEEIIMVGRVGHGELYRDFVDKYIEIECESEETDAWKLDGIEPLLFKEILDKYPNHNYMSPINAFKNLPKKFFKYGNKRDHFIDPLIVFHARNTSKCGTDYRNWENKTCNGLASVLINEDKYSIVSMGSMKNAYVPMGTWDMRGLDMYQVIDIVKNATVVIGPSSGPMHLASLCGTPHIVWTDKKVHDDINGTNRQRYESIWNPFNTQAIVIDEEGWNPSLDTIYDTLKGFLDGKDS